MTTTLTPARLRPPPTPASATFCWSSPGLWSPFLYMVPVIVVAVILLCFVTEKPLATTIEHDILPETLETDGGTYVGLEPSADAALDADSEAAASARPVDATS